MRMVSTAAMSLGLSAVVVAAIACLAGGRAVWFRGRYTALY